MGLAVTSGAASAVRSTNMRSMIDEESSRCESGEDSMACIKVRAMRFLENVITKDSYKLADVEVRANGYHSAAESNARSHGSGDLFDAIENYIQGHDAVVDLPVAGASAKVTVSSRNLNNNELSLNLRFADDAADAVEGKGKKGSLFKKGKKHRLRKIAMPIMVLILLKAMTVIPMAIGILKIKAFNALALGFFSFIVSVGLAIFQLCKKIAAEHHSAHITAHGPWDGRSAGATTTTNIAQQQRQLETAHNLAYNAYA